MNSDPEGREEPSVQAMMRAIAAAYDDGVDALPLEGVTSNRMLHILRAAYAEDSLRERCGVLEKALEYYAAGSTWEAELDEIQMPTLPPPVESDRGCRARAALGKEEEAG